MKYGIILLIVWSLTGCVGIRFCGESITTNCKPMKPDNKSGPSRGLVEIMGIWQW